MTDRDYSKDRVHHVSYSEALDKAKSGWVIARSGWNGIGMCVFMAREGTFVAADLVSGFLKPFLVMRTVHGEYVPWLCSQSDAMSDDWVCITRQAFQRQTGGWPNREQEARERHEGQRSYPGSDGQERLVQGVQRPSTYRGGIATSDSDFDAD